MRTAILRRLAGSGSQATEPTFGMLHLEMSGAIEWILYARASTKGHGRENSSRAANESKMGPGHEWRCNQNPGAAKKFCGAKASPMPSGTKAGRLSPARHHS